MHVIIRGPKDARWDVFPRHADDLHRRLSGILCYDIHEALIEEIQRVYMSKRFAFSRFRRKMRFSVRSGDYRQRTTQRGLYLLIEMVSIAFWKMRVDSWKIQDEKMGIFA